MPVQRVAVHGSARVSTGVSEPTAVEQAPLRRTWQPAQVFPATTALVLAACVPIYAFILTPRDVKALTTPGLDFWQEAVLTVLLVGIFLFCELVPLRVEVRTETMMVALFEFPLVVGFLVLPWPLVLGAQLVAGVSVYVLRKDDWPHSLLNVALVLIDTGVALSAMIALSLMTQQTTSAIAPLIVAAGVLAGTMASPMIVGLAYRLLGPVEPVWKVLARSSGGACFVIVFALVEYLLWTQNEGMGPYVAVALMAAVVMIYLAFRSMMSRHANLQQLYTFIRTVGDTQADNSRWPELMEMVRSQNNAATAVLYLEDATDFIATPSVVVGPPKLVGLAVDSHGQVGVAPVGPDDHLLQLAATQGVVRASVDKDTDPLVLAALRARGVKAVMIVALTASNRVRGYAEVRDRLSRWGEFTEEDAEFLGTLSVHMGTALENVQLLANLRNEAYRDSVTGLRSRAGLTVDAEELLDHDRLGGLALIQLDTLSQVNNALGHRHGEELLVQAGERIQRTGPHRAVARLESDLFAILLEPMAEADFAAEVAGILRAISPSYSLAGVDVEVEPHAGIALVVEEHSLEHPDAAALLQRAEMALLASRSRHERFEIFRPTMGEVYRRRFQLVTQFRAAVEQGHIVVHYQPKVTLQDNQLRGVEALVRWVHPEFGMVTPGEFVTAIEATGSIDILLNHVLEIVLVQINQWLSRGMRISVAVNLSMRNLTGKHFPERVAAALQRYQVPADLLTFELTESNVMTDPETAMPILDALHAMGIKLSVDDFGTGYSSLAYLRRLPIDEIKIDRSFVLGMSTALGDLAIVQSIIDLGHSLGLEVIAEGVEEDRSRQILTSMKCDGIQGFLLSRPQPVDRFEAWLEARTVRATGSPELPVMRIVG